MVTQFILEISLSWIYIKGTWSLCNLLPRVFYSALSHSLEKDPGGRWSRVCDQNYSFREGRPFQLLHVLTSNLMGLFIKEVLK